MVKSGDLEIYKAHTFVVDEADMTLDMGFLDTVDKIAGTLPKDVQILVFSATIPQKIATLLEKIFDNPVMEKSRQLLLSQIQSIIGWFQLRDVIKMRKSWKSLKP